MQNDFGDTNSQKRSNSGEVPFIIHNIGTEKSGSMAPRPFSDDLDTSFKRDNKDILALRASQRGTFHARRSMTDQVKETMSKNVQVFGKLPIDAFEIRSEKEHRLLVLKSVAFLVLDLILLVCLITVFVIDSDDELTALEVYMTIMLFASFIIDAWTWYQINLYFIQKRLAIISLLLDLFIFCGGIWEIIAFIGLNLASDDTLFIAFGIIVIALTFLRVTNIVSIILYTFFCLPLYCFPESCWCRRILDKDEIDVAAISYLESHEWVYNENAMLGKSQKARCMICLCDIKHSETVWLIPCPPTQRLERSKNGSSFGDTFSSKKKSTISGNSQEQHKIQHASGDVYGLTNENNFNLCDYDHNLHKVCLLKWFESHVECPVCRGPIRPDLWHLQKINDENKAGYCQTISLDDSLR